MVAKRGSILRDFLKDEAAGGIVLIVAAVLAMIAANSPLLGGKFTRLLGALGNLLCSGFGLAGHIVALALSAFLFLGVRH